MNEKSKAVRPLVLAATMAVGLGLATTACGGHRSQTSAAATSASSSSVAGVAGAGSTTPSTPATSTTSSTSSTPGAMSTPSAPGRTAASSAAGSPPSTTPTTSARPSSPPTTRPAPPINPTTPPSTPTTNPPTGSTPAWLADPGGAYGWQQSQPSRQVSWDLTRNESLCYGLNEAPQIEEQQFRAEHRTARARRQTFEYADPTAAAAAYGTAVKQMASCQDELRAQQGRSAAKVPQDATVVTTASRADGQAWSESWTGVATPMSAAGRQVDRVYLVLQGSTVTLLETDDFGADAPATDDPGVLSALGR